MCVCVCVCVHVPVCVLVCVHVCMHVSVWVGVGAGGKLVIGCIKIYTMLMLLLYTVNYTNR